MDESSSTGLISLFLANNDHNLQSMYLNVKYIPVVIFHCINDVNTPPQAIDTIHQVGLYCLALVPANTLPKTPLGGIHVSETKHCFVEGSLHPCNILMCPHTCVTNLPKPRQKQPGTHF